MCSVILFNDTETPEIYTLSLHDALPISLLRMTAVLRSGGGCRRSSPRSPRLRARLPSSRQPSRAESREPPYATRSEEHTSELQSRQYLVCRLLLVKKNNSPTCTISLLHS